MDWSKIPYTKMIIQKQCEFAKINFDDVDFNENWYHENTWTSEQEKGFKEWILDFMYHNFGARKELMSVKSKSKKNIEKWWHWWNLMYGFRIKDD